MANIKFSAFTQKVVLGDVDFLVGYTGADNVRVAPSVFSGIYLPLAGGTMTGIVGVVAPDNFKWNFGTGSDSELYHTGSHFFLDNSVGTTYIRNTATGGSGILLRNSTIGDIQFDNEFAGNILFNTSNVTRLTIDSSGNATFEENIIGKDTFYLENAGGKRWQQLFDSDNWNIRYYNGSSWGADALAIDTSGNVGIGTSTPAKKLHVSSADNQLARFESTDAYGGIEICDNTSGAAKPLISALGNAFIFYNGGGSHTEAMRIISSGNVGIGATNPIEKLDVDGAIISTASNTTSSTAGANRAIMDLTSGGARLGHFRGTTAAGSGSVKLYSDSVLGITLDASQNATFAGNIELGDGQQLQCGPLSGGDLKVYWDTADGNIINKTGDLYIKNQGNDKDIYFETDDGSGGTRVYIHMDGSEAAVGDACWTIWPDNSRIGIGDSKEMQMHHEAGNNYITQTVGDLVISNTANDKDIQFKSDDGAGNIAIYYYLDGSIVKNRFPKDVYLEDDVKLLFGDASTPDLEIYHNGSHSWISDQGTGNLNILTSSLNVNNAADTQNMIIATQGGAVSLYTNGVLKLQTSSTGTVTTGQMDITALNTAPASAGAAGTLGEIRYTADYIYVCTATNTWKRTAISTW